jgi:hypothetical protein
VLMDCKFSSVKKSLHIEKTPAMFLGCYFFSMIRVQQQKTPTFGVFCYLRFLKGSKYKCLEFKLGYMPFFCFWSG